MPPLPEGALYRLGSVRLLHLGGVISVMVTPDGKTVVSAGEGDALDYFVAGQGTPWLGLVTGRTPRFTNFCTRLPS